jgi:hypothetical protein
MIRSVLVLLTICLTAAIQAQQPSPVDHDKGVKDRGDVVMGFSHEKTAHHFLLYADGGAIEIEVKGQNPEPAERRAPLASPDASGQGISPNDTAIRDQIRMHLTHFSRLFAEGNFIGPMLIHAENVPGTAVMKQLREEIRYQAEPTERGARMRITTANAKALAAVHEFLRFQIKDHRTGDATTIQPASRN